MNWSVFTQGVKPRNINHLQYAGGTRQDPARSIQMVRKNLQVKRYGNNDVHFVLKNAATAAIQSPYKEDEYISFSRSSSLRRAYRQNSS